MALFIKRVDVFANEHLVGTLAEYGKGRIAFEYSDRWIAEGFSISPFSLSLEKRIFTSETNDFEGLFGVFDDSLPDGWGRLLTDRYLKTKGIDYNAINQLTRLSMLSDTASGLLEYYPRQNLEDDSDPDNLEALFTTAESILSNSAASASDVEQLYIRGSSSGGARPKINITIDGELWIVKFPTSFDGSDAGTREYECNRRAVDAGLDVADFKLMDSQSTKGFFASKRFDRKNGKRIHMLSLSGLLESSHRFPALDYKHLLYSTMLLTHSKEELYEAFRRACFNIFIGNRDDHGKNFAFLYETEKKEWHLSPVYDLTRSRTYYGEHSTTVCGKGKDITEDDLRELADAFKLQEKTREEIIRDTKKAAQGFADN